MPIECNERFGSRRISSNADSTSLETLWVVEGSNDPDAVRAAVFATAPPIFSDSIQGWTLYAGSMDVEQIGYQVWNATLTYSGGAGQPFDQPEPGPDGVSFSFDTSGGTAHISQSKATKSYEVPVQIPFLPNGEPSDFQGAIGVSKDSVDGVDIVIPSLKFSETHDIPATAITFAYVNTLASLTGSVNAGPWRVFQAEQVLFVGASGQSQAQGVVPVTFNFEVGINADALQVAGASVNKRAHEYVWTYYEDKEDSDVKKLLKKPQWVYVETVYPTADFTQLGIS